MADPGAINLCRHGQCDAPWQKDELCWWRYGCANLATSDAQIIFGNPNNDACSICEHACTNAQLVNMDKLLRGPPLVMPLLSHVGPIKHHSKEQCFEDAGGGTAGIIFARYHAHPDGTPVLRYRRSVTSAPYGLSHRTYITLWRHWRPMLSGNLGSIHASHQPPPRPSRYSGAHAIECGHQQAPWSPHG